MTNSKNNYLKEDKYEKLRKTISIIIVDDEMTQFKGIHKAHTKWQIREEK